MAPGELVAWITLGFVASPLVAYLVYWIYKRVRRSDKAGENASDE